MWKKNPANNFWEYDSEIAIINSISSERNTIRYKVMMEIARDLSQLATCALHKVGCLLYDPIKKDIIKVGYNGSPHGDEHCSEFNRVVDGAHHLNCIHAEINALIKAGEAAKGAILFCTLSPCRRCAIACKQAGILEFVYLNEYHTNDGRSDDMLFARQYFQERDIRLTWMSPSMMR